MAETVKPGCKVRIERDETRYPSRGTWPQFRGRTGVVVEINRAGKGATEYGVVFGKVRDRPDRPGQFSHGDVVTWFKRYELAVVATGGDAA